MAYLVSVIIPVYNVEKYLRDCLNSVLSQNFCDYEIICVEDKSTDASAVILEEYKNNEKIKIFYHKENRGLSAARNTGLTNASGKYIYFLDSDDMLKENALLNMYTYADKYGVDILYFNYDVISEDGLSQLDTPRQYEGPPYVNSGESFFQKSLTDKIFHVMVWRQFFKSDFLLDNKLNFYEGITFEDKLFSFLCVLRAKNVCYLGESYYLYRNRNTSISKSEKGNRGVLSIECVLKESIKFWNRYKASFSTEVNNAIRAWLIMIYRDYLYRKNAIYDDTIYYDDMQQGEIEKDLKPREEDVFQYVYLSAENLKRIQLAEKIFVYGAGRVAFEIILLLKRANCNIDGIIVSNIESNPKKLCGIEVRPIEEYTSFSEMTIIIGTSRKHVSSIKEKIERLEVKDTVVMDER